MHRNWVIRLLSGQCRGNRHDIVYTSVRSGRVRQLSSHRTDSIAVNGAPSNHQSGLHVTSSTSNQVYCQRYASMLSPQLRQNKMECQKFRKDALSIFWTAVESVYPPKMIRNALTLSSDGSSFIVNGKEYELDHNVYIVGFGKAVSGMARAMEDILGPHLIKGVVSIPYGSQQLFRDLGKDELCIQDNVKIQVFEGAKNNLPDEDAHMAAMAIEKLASNLGKNDILLVLISGGGSALLPSPIPPLTLQEEQDLTRILSVHGATIQQLNILRQNIEKLKGGGLAQIASPAKVVSLILSDVIGDKLDLISSGPTAPLLSSPRQSLQILEMLGLMDKVPQSALSLLQQRASAKKTVQETSPQQQLSMSSRREDKLEHVHNVVIGSNTVATQAAKKEATELGYISLVLTNSLEGDCELSAQMYLLLVKYITLGFGDIPPDESKAELTQAELELTQIGLSKADLKKITDVSRHAYSSRQGICIICGGETTVEVTGTGKGGRNQEMALAFALKYDEWLRGDKSKSYDKFHVEFLSAGTDGQDGPTDSAGAVVNKHLMPLAITQKLKAKDFLKNNDSYNFFKSLVDCDNHIMSGLTGTNVMDIQVLIIKYLG